MCSDCGSSHSSSQSDNGSGHSSSQWEDDTNVDLDSELPEAIERGSIEDVERLLRFDGAITIRFEYHFQSCILPTTGVTPLILAAGLEQHAIAKLLLDHGASIDELTDDYGASPIHFASGVEMTDLLLENGALVDEGDFSERTPLHWACWYGKVDTARLLVSKGADVNLVDTYGQGALAFASEHGRPETVRFLLDLETEGEGTGISRKKLVDRNLQQWDGTTALIWALYRSQIDCAKELLLDSAVDVTLQDNGNETALSWAAKGDLLSPMLQLLGTKVYFPDDPVSSTCCIATQSEHSFIDGALSRQIKQIMRNPQGQESTMHWAVANGSVKLVQKCLERQPDLVRWSRMGATWLHVAAKYGRHELIKILVDRGIDLRATANRGTTALHLAAEGGHRIVVKYILEHLREIMKSPGHETNVRAAGGSPLPSLELVHLVTKEDNDGRSPITLSGKASNRGASDILWGEIETFAMTTPNFVESLPMESERLLELAAQFENPGDERILKLLLGQTSKKDLGWKSRNWTALHWAVYSSRAVLVWWLLSNGAHLRSEEIQAALDIVKEKSNCGHGISEVDLLITDLLQNPPMVSCHAVNEDDYHLPELPALSDDHREFLGHEGIIVDFYPRDETTDFRFKRRNLQDIIYERGPNEIMESIGRYNYNDLEGLKQHLETTQQTPQQKLIPEIRRRATSETATGTFKSEPPKKPSAGWKSFEEGYNINEGNKLSAGFKTTQRQRGLRWIHIPAHDMKLAEDLITRIVIDSGKKKQQHASLVSLIKQSLIEVAAGGGKYYMKPQCIRRTIDDEGCTDEIDQPSYDSDGDSNSNDTDGSEESTNSETSSDTDGGSVALYMPFLTVSEIQASIDSCHREEDVRSRTVQSHGVKERDPSNIPHGRMTLDQYYYTTLPDSTYRDQDQVLSRYLEWQESKYFKHNQMLSSGDLGQSGQSIKIFSIDQLWLWIIDEATIITATTSDFEGFVDVIFDALVLGETKAGFPPPTSAQFMMECILSIVTGPQLQNIPVLGQKKTKHPLEIFRESIRHVADIETEMSRNFIDSVLRGYGAVLPTRNVGKEFRLLYEIKDIRDELNILKMLTETQAMIWRRAFGTNQSGDSSGRNHPQNPRKIRLEIKGISREAESTQDAINTLLELRQKHAGNQDAEFGRQQANTTMVFTIVTIIFLPLSFLASLFALDVSAFPHESANLKYKSSWIFPIIFGCAAAVSIPSIIIAFYVNELIMVPYHRWRYSSPSGRSSRNQRLGSSSVHRMTTEETLDSSTDNDFVSVDTFWKGGRTTGGDISQHPMGKSASSSLYDRFLRKPRYQYRRTDDCECGKEY